MKVYSYKERNFPMNAAGIVVEYNPFHNGHFYHVNETKRKAESDVIIAVMSGSFLQRGEPALVDKWTRTKMALSNGVDIVVELPYAFSTQKAETFAAGAIQILNHMKCRSFCFGSEDGQMDPFLQSVARLDEEKEALDKCVRSIMKKGSSYPAAQTLARKLIFRDQPLPLDLSKPNNILGFHYVKANNELNDPMQPLTILRQGAGYHDKQASGHIASATAVRKLLFDQKQADHFLPHSVLSILTEHKQNGLIHSWEIYWPLLRYRLLSIHSHDLNAIYEIEEGIGPRLIDAALKSDTFVSFMERVKTKRYTWTRIQRMMTHVLTNTTKQQMNNAAANISFVRLLGMTENGRGYIRTIKKDMSVPLLSRTAAGADLLALDIKASRVYAAAPTAPAHYMEQLLDQEFSAPPILL
jgi:predicted nucleotidyltransferase